MKFYFLSNILHIFIKPKLGHLEYCIQTHCVEKKIESVGAGKFIHSKVRRKVSLHMQSPEFADNTAPRWNIGANLLMPA